MFGSSNCTIIQTQISRTTQNQASAMTIPVLWTEPCRKWVRWTEEKKHRHGSVNVKGLERFWMKEWSLISCQVFSNLIRHYRRKCRAVKLANGDFKKYWIKAVNCGQCVLEKNINFIMIFPTILNSYPMKDWIFVIFYLFIKDQKHLQCRFIFTAFFDHIYQGCQ